MQVIYNCPSCGGTQTIKKRSGQTEQGFLSIMPQEVGCPNQECLGLMHADMDRWPNPLGEDEKRVYKLTWGLDWSAVCGVIDFNEPEFSDGVLFNGLSCGFSYIIKGVLNDEFNLDHIYVIPIREATNDSTNASSGGSTEPAVEREDTLGRGR